MERVLAIKDHKGLCWKCLQDKPQIHNIPIHEMGYGSGFDGWSTEIHLCKECYQESIKDNPELWSMKEIQCDWDKSEESDEYKFYEYKYEDEMFKYIEALPLQSKQFVQNEFSRGYMADHKMEAQDWIDYQLDLLPHEKCKEYGYYSPEEIKAYEERFPTCEYVVNRIWNDKSNTSCCPFEASGDYNQECSCNIATKCYGCNYYTMRTTPIKDIKNNEFEDYMEYLKMKIRQRELRKKFETA